MPDLPLAPAPGRMNVDFEERVDFARLRRYRLDRAKQAMEQAGLGALLVFDNNNIRYLTGVAIGEWTRDKLCRYALYTRTGELVLWDFGSAAVHHRLYCPWLKPENCIASYTTMRGAAPPASGLTAKQVAEIKDRLEQAGIKERARRRRLRRGPHLLRAAAQHIDIRDGQQVMLDARQIKSRDEIALLSTAAAMVDGTYADIAEALEARGAGERDRRAGEQAPVRDGLGRRRVGQRGLRRAVQPASAQLLRPHDQAGGAGVLRHHALLQRLPDLLLPLLRGRPREPAAKRRVQKGPGVDRRRHRDDQARGVHRPGGPAVADRAGDRAAGREDGVRLLFGHGLGLALHERPIISRLTSLDAPMEIKEGMVFALETYCPATDGRSPPGSRRRSWSARPGSRS
jgi:Xaa-Pro aminopeptidase